jgi:hypothetical protein
MDEATHKLSGRHEARSRHTRLREACREREVGADFSDRKCSIKSL